MSLYLLHAKAGREFEASEDLRALGLTVYCARKMEFVRTGNNRRPEPRVSAYLPNYIFAEIPAHKFLDAVAVKHIASTAMPVASRNLEAVHNFLAVTEAEYTTAEKIKNNRDLVAHYRTGQALKCLDGPMQDVMLAFVSLVERSHDLHPKVRAEGEFMGQMTTFEFDPLDVRAAE